MTKLKKDDLVIVTKGRDKGKSGKIMAVFSDKQKVLVEKINIVTKHQKKNQKGQGGIVKMPSPMAWANVKLVCPETGKPTRVFYHEAGEKKKRKAKVSGAIFK